MIIQVGHFPPPIGGVSIYLKRMKENLDSKSIENIVWDTSASKKKPINNVKKIHLSLVPFYFLKRKKTDIIHYNISGILTKNYIGFFNNLFFRHRKKVLTIHGDCRGLLNKGNRYIISSLNTFDKIICVRQNNSHHLSANGVTTGLYEIPAFIPPRIDKRQIDDVPQNVWDFIASRYPTITANAYQIVFNRGEDLYGIDMCVDLCYNLKKYYPEIGFIFFLPNISNTRYFEELKRRVQSKGISNNFLFQTKPCQLYPVIMKSNMFVRPTNTDGDSVSVREAIHFKIPTLASDIAPRPPGTILFKNRNVKDFTSKAKSIFGQYDYYKKNLELSKLKDNFEMIMKVYGEL